MTLDLDALKLKFREGRHAEAIGEGAALLARHPTDLALLRLCAMMHVVARRFDGALPLLAQVHEKLPRDADTLFNIALCQRELKRFADAAASFEAYAQLHPEQADGWAGLAECRLELRAFSDGRAAAERALRFDAACVPAWVALAKCQRALGQSSEALTSLNRAIELSSAPDELRLLRAGLFEDTGRLADAVVEYSAVLAAQPSHAAALQRATTILLELNRGDEGIALCREVLKADPDNLTARLGAEWLLSKMVPLWHMPMMNEEARNRPYFEALKAVVGPDTLVFEIGTGSGLLSMMAGRLGAREVVSCEAVRLVADTARRIVERNGLDDRVRVLSKPSYQVEVGADLPRRADVLVHEIFSSELLGEFVLPALEDAKARLLAPDARILPAVASLMVALVGGEGLGKELHVDEAFGFDLRPFNEIHPKKRPIHREDLPRALLSGDVEAFRFDFTAQHTFPAEKKRLSIPVTGSGRCWGLIQWIRFEFAPGIAFENHPSVSRPVASWQQTIYRFNEPLDLEPGETVTVDAMHDRTRPWFEQVP